AGELAAGAGAPESGLGEVDLRLVGLLAAALALAPGRLFARPERLPAARVGQLLARLCRAGVRRQRLHLLRRPGLPHRSVSGTPGRRASRAPRPPRYGSEEAAGFLR